jgi:tetratricopeptide (TPR) repeat protein
MQTGASFVGRDRELRELSDALDDVGAGRGRVVLIGGEPGIGKSRLADELATRARELGHQVLWGRGWEDAGAPAYWPWVQALRSYLRSTDPDEVRRQMASGAGDIAQMLPEVRDLFPELPTPPDAESESARFQLFDSTATFLRNAARSRPMLVVLDDLQAADTPSILLLRFLASQMADMRVLLVGTYRDIELTPEHPLTAALAEVAREPITRTLVLSGLAADAVGEFIRSSADVTPHAHLIGAVWRETNGNPLFVGEAVRLLSAEGRLNDVADLASLRLVVPAGIRAVIARRIGNLSEACGRALGLGAALGPEFSLEVLRRVGDFEVDKASDLVDEAVQAGLLLPVAGAHGRYRFSHDLVRETLYDDLSPGRRSRLHRRIADVLEAVHAASIDAHLAEIAFHYVEAALGGDEGPATKGREPVGPKAIDYARRAGDQAARSLAYEEADRLYRMALAGLEVTDAPDERSRTEILLALGEVQARSGDLEGARATYLLAADTARRTGAAEHMAQAALGCGGRLQWARPGRDTRLLPLLQEALVMLGGGDKRLRVRLLSRLACAWRSSPDRRDDSATFSQQAVQLARELDDPATLSYALAARYWAIWWPENLIERHPIAVEMLAVAEALGDGERLIDAHLMLFMDYSERGRMSEARKAVEAVTRLANELRQPAQLWLAVAPRSLLALIDGDFALVEELIPRMLDARLHMPATRDDESAGRMQRFLLRREQGRSGEELETVQASVEDFPWYPVYRAALVCLLVDIGHDAEAREIFNDMSRGEFGMFYRDSEWLLGISLASEACALLVDASAAATLYEQLEPFAGRHAHGHAEGSVGAVDRYLGLLAATLGRLADAERHQRAAIEIHERMGARPWTAHSQHDLAVVLVRRDAPGDRDEADRLDRAALETARTLGMALAEEIGGGAEVPTSTAVQATPVTSATFRREGEYWTVEFGRDTFRIRDAKGMRHLARLFEAPGREVHALELARFETSTSDANRIGDSSLTAGGLGDAGPLLDAEAKAAYRERLDELREDLAEAESWNDPERAARLRAEADALTHELTAAMGLGGRDRPAASAAERARISVTRAIRAALARIGEHSAALNAHLDATIRTGTFCSYTPDPRAPISWRL